MALSVLQFYNRFPEFRQTAEALVQQKIDEAERRTAAATWGDRADDGAAYLAAHLLAVSPSGELARVVQSGARGRNDIATTQYLEERRRMEREVTFGLRVS